jgi:hypothetical protein
VHPDEFLEFVMDIELPNEQAALKSAFLAITSLGWTGKGCQRWVNRWKTSINAFEIVFGGCLTRSRK